jgi:hypothetical protein
MRKATFRSSLEDAARLMDRVAVTLVAATQLRMGVA